MKRTKLPALTSPWKIGFFVSLMMVTVGVGVAYFFIDKFGVSWNWLDKNEWMGAIRGEGFVFELLPVIAAVMVTAMISHLVIARAVRKYKSYLDSGLDYKHLLMSLKEISDLEDKSKIEKIRNHPEFKRLLVGVSEQLTEQREALAAREAEMEKAVDDAVTARHEELTNGFAVECESLTSAIRDGAADLISPETGVSNPSLRSLCEVLQTRLESEVPSAAPAPTAVVESDAAVKIKLEEIANELGESSRGAREIEDLVRKTSAGDLPESDIGRLEAARGEMRGVLDAMKSLQELKSSLVSLSEEAKGIAINTALHAGSGEGTQDDLIRLAEEVKDIAMRFKAETERMADVSSRMRSSVGSLEAFVGSELNPNTAEADPGHSLASISNKLSLWVERVMVLSEKVSGFSASLDEPVAPEQDAEKPFDMKDIPAAEMDGDFDKTESDGRFADSSEEFGFEMLDRSKSLFSDATDEEPAAPADKEILDETPSDAEMDESLEAASADDAANADAGEPELETKTVADELVDDGVASPSEDAPDPAQESTDTSTEDEAGTIDIPGFETFERSSPPSRDAVAPSVDSSVEPQQFQVDEDRFAGHEDRLEPMKDTEAPEEESAEGEGKPVESAPEKLQSEDLD